jgi:hypothetical protein
LVLGPWFSLSVLPARNCPAKNFWQKPFLFSYFCWKQFNMAEISISNKDWERVKIKIQRKYNHLSDEQLQYTQGQEESLISKLMELVKRDRNYIIFTLKKALVNIDNNRL